MPLQSRLSRFTGASAISSADFYGEEDDDRGRGRGGRGNNNNTNFDIENMNASELMGRLSVQVGLPVGCTCKSRQQAFVLFEVLKILQIGFTSFYTLLGPRDKLFTLIPHAARSQTGKQRNAAYLCQVLCGADDI